ncbi:MAG: peptidoglycan DD-metalloendopeptidase family protein [Dehalococcoidia bacterium]
MAFIVQRARTRAQHRAGRSASAASGGFRLAPSFASPLPAMNQAMRRGLTHRRPIAAAMIPGVLLAVLALNWAGPHARTGAPLPFAATQAQSRIATAGTTGSLAGLAAPGFPGGIGAAFDTASGQIAARVPAVLAADLWQAANAVYQSNIAGVVLGVPSPQTAAAAAAAVTKPAGPTLDELLRAQARVASAQLVLLSLQQHATDDQISAAQSAVAQAQTQLTAAQNALAQPAALVQQSQLNLSPAAATVAATATPAPAPTVSPEQIVAAQADVDRARAALAKAQHPFTDAQIAAAQQQLVTSQAALNAALARASAAVAAPPAATAAPPAIAAATAAPTPAKPPATPVPTVSPPEDPAAAIRGPIPGVVDGAPGNHAGLGQGSSPLPDALARNPFDASAAPAAPAANPFDGSASVAAPAANPFDTSAAPSAAAGDPSPVASANTVAPAGVMPAALAASAPVAAAPIAAPAAAAAPAAPAAPSATPVASASGERTAAVPAKDDIPALREWLSISQQAVALYTAPPDPQTVQAATDALAAAEQRLAELQGTPAQDAAGGSSESATNASVASATTTPTASPTPDPTATPAPPPSAAASPPPLDVAQAAYQQAVTQLQWMSVQPDPATVKAAEEDYNTAKLALADLLAQADQSVAGQLDPNPQTALAKVGFVGSGLPQHDAVAFAWPAIGPITSYFGPSHPLGIDIGQGLGLPVRATASGVVSFSGGDPCCSYGYYIDIQHAGGYMSRYGHLLTRSFLKPGDKVVQGQIIGVSGSTGFSTGPHVHFEIRFNGVPLDGLKFLAGALPAPLGR